MPCSSIAVRAEVADERLEDEVDDVGGRLVELGLLEDQLGVGDEREELGQRLLEVEVAGHLLGRQRRLAASMRDQRVGLLAEERDVRHAGEGVEDRPPVGERDPAQAAGRALVEEERVVGGVACARAARRGLALPNR